MAVDPTPSQALQIILTAVALFFFALAYRG